MKLSSAWTQLLPGGLFNAVAPLAIQNVPEIDFPGRNDVHLEKGATDTFSPVTVSTSKGRNGEKTNSAKEVRLYRSLRKDLKATKDIIQRAATMAERLQKSQQTVKLWQFASEVMSLINQEMALTRYWRWKNFISLQNLENVEHLEEVATGKKPAKKKRREPETPPIHNPFFSPTPSRSQRGYLAFLRARSVALNKKLHGIQTDFLQFQRLVTGLYHEADTAKVEKTYQTWLLGLEANSRLQADYYAAIIRGEDAASME